MSSRNVELQRRFFEAFNARDVEAMIACCDPSIEFQSRFAAVGGAVYHGHDELRRYQRDMEDAWGDEIRFDPDAYFDLGERTMSTGSLHGRGRHSGADVAMQVAVVTRWRDGLMTHFKSYAHKEATLSDLGLTEDDLEPIKP